MKRRKRILVAPLDWGLGHATRCIPVIQGLLNRDCEVFIASSGSALMFLRAEFPNLKSFALSGYNPMYPSGTGSMVLKMGAQVPHFVRTINSEHREIEAIISTEKIDVVISDNRYGCYSSKVKSILIYHQIHLLMPQGWKWMEPIVNNFNNQRIDCFDECWIPADNGDLFPELFRGREKFDSKFVGYLSRFKYEESEHEYDVTAIASGPSPQREVFVSMIEKLFGSTSKQKCFLVKGDVNGGSVATQNDNCTVANYLNSDSLNRLVSKSKLIIARSGYSTVMDLMATKKKALFVPTPGQTEQEYIGNRLMNAGISFCHNQNEPFDVGILSAAINNYEGFVNEYGNDKLLSKALDSLL